MLIQQTFIMSGHCLIVDQGFCLWYGFGGGGDRQADKADPPDVQGRPKGCILISIPYTSHWYSRTGGGGGGTQTDQILFSPPIVCVQWPITVLHSITNPLCPSPNDTPNHHLQHSIGLFPRSPRTFMHQCPRPPAGVLMLRHLNSDCQETDTLLMDQLSLCLLPPPFCVSPSNISAIRQLSRADARRDQS